MLAYGRWQRLSAEMQRINFEECNFLNRTKRPRRHAENHGLDRYLTCHRLPARGPGRVRPGAGSIGSSWQWKAHCRLVYRDVRRFRLGRRYLHLARCSVGFADLVDSILSQCGSKSLLTILDRRDENLRTLKARL